MLSVEDFLGMKIKPNIEDYLVAVAEVARLKFMYDEEDDLVAEQDEQFCINKHQNITHNIQSILSSFPVTNNLDHQEEPPVGDFVRPRTCTEKFILTKNAVENPQDDHDNNNNIPNIIPQVERVSPIYPRLEKENPPEQVKRVIKIKLRVGASFVVRKELPQKKPHGFSNEELFRIDNLCKQSKEDKEDAREKKKVRRNIEAPVVINNDQLPIDFKNRIIGLEGSVESAVLVIEKKLYETDVTSGQGRLSIPVRQIKNQFLKQEEYEHLCTRDAADNMREKRVELIEPSLGLCKINLRKWQMKNHSGKASSSYVLVTTWNDVTRRNSLRAGNLVQLWAFRKASDELCFALVRVND